MHINKMAEAAHEMSKAKGFWDDHLVDVNVLADFIATPVISQKLMLMVEELAEANGEIRSGHEPVEIYFNGEGPPSLDRKPEGFPIELADVVIRIGDLCHALGIDLEAAILLKMNYNSTRPHKHGRKF